MLPQEETDLSFAEFGGSKRLYPAPGDGPTTPNKNAPGVRHRGRYQNVERETGLEPATPLVEDQRRTGHGEQGHEGAQTPTMELRHADRRDGESGFAEHRHCDDWHKGSAERISR